MHEYHVRLNIGPWMADGCPATQLSKTFKVEAGSEVGAIRLAESSAAARGYRVLSAYSAKVVAK